MKIALFFNVFRHLIRGTCYRRFDMSFQVQTSRPIVEGDVLSCYVDKDGKGWARLKSEFEDGRFADTSATLQWKQLTAMSAFGEYRLEYVVVDFHPYRVLLDEKCIGQCPDLEEARRFAQDDYYARLRGIGVDGNRS